MKFLLNRTIPIIVLSCLLFGSGLIMDQDDDEYVIHTFEKIKLSSTFYAEGAGIGDINGNGQLDVICGPYWYQGPDFEQRHAYYEPREFDLLSYSDNFTVAVHDLTGNGHNDILIVGFPGQAAWWYENPGSEHGYWSRHMIHSNIDNESPKFIDITGDGSLDLVFHEDGYLGYASPDPEDTTNPWIFTRISEHHGWGHFTHGLGVGDINGNGYKDFIMAQGWWENPGPEWDGQTPWEYYPVEFAPGGAQMYAYDVDGDGFNDVITTLQAHGWGLAWHRQVRTEDGDEIGFEKNLIMGESYDDNPYGVRFSNPHALVLTDLNNNGLKDLISGKRWGGSSGGPNPDTQAVVYWFKLERSDDGQVDYIPYLIHDNSGVGTHFVSGDLTGNGYPDIVTCNKKGGHIFLNQPETVTRQEWEAAQPQRIID
jgi:hypothetical protein